MTLVQSLYQSRVRSYCVQMIARRAYTAQPECICFPIGTLEGDKLCAMHSRSIDERRRRRDTIDAFAMRIIHI